MDRLLHIGFQVWKVLILLTITPFLLLLPARALVWLARRFAFLRDRLAPAAARMDRWTGWLIASYMTLFYTILALPILAVAAPVVAAATWLLRRLVPATDETVPHGHRPAVHGLRAHFISLKTMDWPLRLVTAVAIAQVVASALIPLFLLLDMVPAGPVKVGTLHGNPIQVDRLVYHASIVLLAAGWGLALAGAWASTVTRFLLVALFTATAWPGAWSSRAVGVWAGLVGGLWIAALVTSWRARSPAALAPHPRFIRRAIAFAVVFGLFYLGVAWATRAIEGEFPGFVNRQLTYLAFALTPVLFLAGTDFAEIGEAVGGLARRIRGAWMAPIWAIGSAALAASAVGVFKVVDYTGLESLLFTAATVVMAAIIVQIVELVPDKLKWLGCVVLPIGFGLLLIVLVETRGYVAVMLVTVYIAWKAIGWVRKEAEPSGWPSTAIPFAAVAVLALMLTATREIVVLIRAAWSFPADAHAVHFVVRRDSLANRKFSMAVPEHWQLGRLGDSISLRIAGKDMYTEGEMVVTTSPYTPLADGRFDPDAIAEAVFPDLAPIEFSSDGVIARDGRTWRVRSGKVYRSGKTYEVSTWDPQEEPSWLILSVSGARYREYFFRVSYPMVRSWRPDFSAVAPASLPAPDLAHRAARVSGFGFVPILFAVVGWLLLFQLRKSEPLGRPLDRAALFAIAVGVTALLFLPDTELIELWEGAESHHNPLATLQLVAAGATVLLTLYWMIRRQLRAKEWAIREFARLNIGFLVLLLVYSLYGAAIGIGHHSILIQAVVLVVALMWDLLMSGKEITNVDGRIFRRPARVLIYLGYLTLVCTVVLFFSNQTSAGKPVEKILEAEDVVRQGIIWLGTPILLLNALLRLARRQEPLQPTAGQHQTG